MALPKVYIGKDPFFIMIFAAFEVYKTECLGFMIGPSPTEGKNRFWVRAAAPFQRVKRFLNELEQEGRGFSRSIQFSELTRTSSFQFLGNFHAHLVKGSKKPPVEMSGRDRNYMKINGDALEVIIAVWPRLDGPKIRWRILPDGSIEGTFAHLYFHFNVYTLVDENGDKVPKRLQIVASSAIRALNKLSKRSK